MSTLLADGRLRSFILVGKKVVVKNILSPGPNLGKVPKPRRIPFGRPLLLHFFLGIHPDWLTNPRKVFSSFSFPIVRCCVCCSANFLFSDRVSVGRCKTAATQTQGD